MPAASVAVAVRLWFPLPRTVLVMLQVPPAVATALPTAVVPSNSVTMLPAGAEPVTVGVVTLVTLSVLDTPLSEPGVRSGVNGAACTLDGPKTAIGAAVAALFGALSPFAARIVLSVL